MLTGLSLALFISLFAFHEQILGYHDASGHVRLALFAAFVFGIICGYRTRG